MVLLLARVIGVGLETADMLVHEILSRNLRDQRAVARYTGLTGAPDESGRKSREKGLANYWLRVFRFSRLEESIEKTNLREGNLDQGDFEIFCALNVDFVVEPTCGIGAQMRPSRKGIGC